MFTRLVESLAATEPLSRVFSDPSVLQAMLDFEAALACAEAQCGVIPGAAAEKIAEAAHAGGFDTGELTRLSLRAGTPAIPLVSMLTARVLAVDPDAAGFVHYGATSQDVADTALVLLLRQCREVLAHDHQRTAEALRRLSVSGVQEAGISDLAIRERKIAGTSIYRTRLVLFYQASLLVDTDISVFARYLSMPTRVPDYRRGRSHEEFCTTLVREGYRGSLQEVRKALQETVDERLPLLR